MPSRRDGTRFDLHLFFQYPDHIAGDGKDRVNSSATYGFTADMAWVEIDPATYQAKIKKYFSVHDAGTILHPGIVEGQVRGSILHGVGSALYEELKYDEHGQMITASFADYLVPTAMETPDMVLLDHMETPAPLTVLGAKGIGEASSQTAPVAIANAVDDALKPLGINITTLPLAPSFLWELAQKKNRGGKVANEKI